MSNFDFLGSFLGKKAQTKKDGHDMSNKEVMSMPFGVNVPLKHYTVVPNEHYRVDCGGVVQTAPMREDNFASIYSNMKAVFVPLSSLSRDYLNMTQASRSTRKDLLFDFIPKEPTFDLAAVLQFIYPSFHYSKLIENFISNVPNYESLNFFVDPHVGVIINDGENVAPAAEYFRDKVTTDDAIFWTFVTGVLANFQASEPSETFSFGKMVDCVRRLTTLSGCPIYMDALRLLDNLGFGNFLPVLDSVFNMFLGEHHSYFSYLGFQVVGNDGEDINIWIDRTHYSDLHATFLDNTKVVSLLPLFAYQYYIWTCERSDYRNPTDSVLTVDALQAHIMDIDAFNRTTFLLYSFDVDELAETYEEWPICVEQFIQYVSIGAGLSSWSKKDFYLYLFGLTSPLLGSDVYTSSQLSVVSGTIPGTAALDLQTNLVKAYAETSALYNLRQDLLRAGVSRRNQMQAIFGVKGNQHVFEPLKILDSSRSELDIQGLLNQAETELAPLGARAARGNGKFGISFSFDSEDYGYIFIVQSYTSDMFYENFMIRREHTLDPSSWWLPYWNHLGLEALKRTQLNFMNMSSCSSRFTGNPSQIYSFNDDTIGFTARNFELKQDVNRVHGLFTNFGFSQAFVDTSSIATRYLPKNYAQGNAAFGGFVPTLIDAQVNNYDNSEDLYYKPDMVNNLFVDMVDGALFNGYANDHFREAFVFKCHKVSPFPKLGLFKLDI